MATTYDRNLGTGVPAIGATKCSVVKFENISLVGLVVSDVLQLCWFDKPVAVLGGGVVMVTAEGTASALSVDLGVTAGDTVVDGGDIQAGAAGDILTGGTNATTFTVINGTSAAPDSLDLKIAAVTGDIDDSIVDVYAVVCDLSDTVG